MVGGTRARRARSLLCGVAVIAAGAGLAVGCGAADDATDAIKGKALQEAAEGRWACAPAKVTEETDTFEIEIRAGSFTIFPNAGDAPVEQLPGLWTIEDGDLVIEFTGVAAGGGPLFEVLDFDELTSESDGFTLAAAGVVADDLAAEGEDTTSELAVETDGTDAITLTASGGGDTWTCTRR